MNLPADVRIDALHVLLGEQEQQRAALQLRIHDLDRFKSNATEAIEKLSELLDRATARSAVLETIIPALLSSAAPEVLAQAQSDLEIRWKEELQAGLDPSSRYASAFESAARRAVAGVQLPR